MIAVRAKLGISHLLEVAIENIAWNPVRGSVVTVRKECFPSEGMFLSEFEKYHLG